MLQSQQALRDVNEEFHSRHIDSIVIVFDSPGLETHDPKLYQNNWFLCYARTLVERKCDGLTVDYKLFMHVHTLRRKMQNQHQDE